MPTKYDIGNVYRGDTWHRLIPLERSGTPISETEALSLKGRFTDLKLQIRRRPNDTEALVTLDSALGHLEIVTSPVPGVLIDGPAALMAKAPRAGTYDLQLTEPRAGDPSGDNVWTFVYGDFGALEDVTR